jgi:hypothetical protein
MAAMAEGKLSFFSFVRRGLATALTAPDTAPAGTDHTVITLRVSPKTSDTNPLSSDVALSLTGPGDIVGLDPSVVVRIWPKADDFDAEFIPYALIEFDQADLPWRYTPAIATGDVSAHTDHLRSWFSLVVVPAASAKIDPPTPKQKLPILNVALADLPTPLDLWAFAHTQFTGDNLSDATVKGQINGPPGQFVARLLSPRLLQQKVEYLACLVPTFERGRRVGTGGTLDETVDALTAAWGTEPDVKLPVYFSWRFATGTAGSFEQVARLITAQALPDTIGRRDMDVLDPGLGLPAASTVDPSVQSNGSLPVEGALLSVAAFEAGRPAWPTAQQGIFLPALRDLLNAPADKKQPLLVPQLYAQWYAAADKLTLPPPAPSPTWFFDLNSDPRDRVAAGQGTEVIQREQQALLAAGWDQVAEIRAVNDKLRVLQLGRGTLIQIFARHFKGMSRQRFYHLTLRVHSRVKCGDKTVCDRVDGSPLVPGFLSSQWIRWSSPRGRIGRVQARPALIGPNPEIIGLLNDCRKPAPEPPPPVTHDPGDVPGGVPCDRIDDLAGLGTEVLERWGLVIMWVVRNLTFTQNGDCWWIAVKALRFAIWLIRIVIDNGDVKRRCKWAAGTLTAQDFLDARPRPGFSGAVFANPEVPEPVPSPGVPGLPSDLDSADAAALRAALVRMFQLTATPAALTCPPPMDLETCRLSLETKLEPELTVGERIISRRFIDPSIFWAPKDPLEPIFAPPEYERPMYEPLARVSQDWILPGLNSMKRDSAGLAVMNQRFIEAYMAGLNHEMTRELLWNEFPTDQRGTYFRQFWDIAGHILEDGSSLPAEQLRDIKVLRQWADDAPLGGNSPRPLPTDGNGQPAPFLVLCVRAQLIQKYPNVIVYAQKVQGSGDSRTLTGEQRHPVFYALLSPDVAFYGFDLTIDDVRNDPSWFFVLQEQPGEPKFAEEGADRTTKTFTDPSSIVLLSDTDNQPLPPVAASSGSRLAATTFQEPFRLGIQGTSMLPDT